MNYVKISDRTVFVRRLNPVVNAMWMAECRKNRLDPYGWNEALLEDDYKVFVRGISGFWLKENYEISDTPKSFTLEDML